MAEYSYSQGLLAAYSTEMKEIHLLDNSGKEYSRVHLDIGETRMLPEINWIAGTPYYSVSFYDSWSDDKSKYYLFHREEGLIYLYEYPGNISFCVDFENNNIILRTNRAGKKNVLDYDVSFPLKRK